MTKPFNCANFHLLRQIMTKKKTYSKPEVTELGEAKEIIRGLTLNKETGGADGLFDDNDNPVSIPD